MRVAPDSIAILSGQDLAETSIVADNPANPPTELSHISVHIAGQAAGILRVSPTQIDIWVPAGLPAGTARVILTDALRATARSTDVTVMPVAPAIFSDIGLRLNYAMAIDVATNAREPFTADGDGTQVRFTGTGWRGAKTFEVWSKDEIGRHWALEVVSRGAMEGRAGVDQATVRLQPEMASIGLLSVWVRADGIDSPPNSIQVLNESLLHSLKRPYQIESPWGPVIAEGNGTQEGVIVPADVAVDRYGTVFIADAENHSIWKLGRAMAERVAGVGTAGYNGDGQFAKNAALNTPTGLAVSLTGEIYIADSGNHRIRKIDVNGVISTIAGNGIAGSLGALGLAIDAQLSNPRDVEVDRFFNVLIADTGNHRVMRISRDKLISPMAGTGEPGFSGDGQAAVQAKLRSPSSLAVTRDGTVFVVEAGNRLIRRITPDGLIRTLTSQEPVENGTDCREATGIRYPARVAVDPAGNLLISDSGAPRVLRLSLDCTVAILTGNGQSGFAGDGSAASGGLVDQPAGLASSGLGEIFIADSGNRRVRQLTWTGAACGQPEELLIPSLWGMSGQTLTGLVRLGCAVDHPVELFLTSSLPIGVPSSVVIPAGSLVAGFDVVLPEVAKATVAHIAAGALNETFTIVPSSRNARQQPTAVVTVTPNWARSGDFILGTVKLSSPAPAGGLDVSLSSSDPAADLMPFVTVPGGYMDVQFVILAKSVSQTVTSDIGAGTGGDPETTPVTIIGDGSDDIDQVPALIAGLTLNPNPVAGGQSTTGTVTLGSPAGPGGVIVYLSTDSPEVSVPASIVIGAGQSSGVFPVTTSAVGALTVVAVTASATNTMTADLTLNAPSTGLGTISSLSIAPTALIGGQENATGTVTLASAAGPGGVLVTLSSNQSSASVPASIVIPQGQDSGTFMVTTSVVGSTTVAGIAATSANSVSVDLTLNATPAGQGTISSLVVAPSTVIGGQENATGTVTLASPAGPGGVLVTLASDNAGASVPASIVIPQGQNSGTFAVTTSPVGSTTVAGITATSANVLNADLTLNAPTAGQGTISGLSLAPSTVVGGQENSTGTVTLAAAAGPGGVLVTLSSDIGAASVPASIVIPQGQNSGSFTVTTAIVGSATVAGITATSANAVNANLTLNAPSAGQGTISGLSLAPSTVVGGQQNSTGTVTLASTAGPGGVLVALSSDIGAASVPVSIVIPQGQISGTFTVTTSAVGSTTVAEITASSANVVSAGLTLTAPSAGQGTIIGLSLAPSTVVGGQENSTGAVTLASPAGPGGVLVTLSSDHGAASVPASIVIPQGQNSGTFTVTTSVVGGATVAGITATSANAVNASLTMNAPSAGQGTLTGLSLAPSTVVGGQENSTGTVTLAAAAGPGGVLVTLSSDNGAASVPASIVIPQGQNSGTFTVTTSVVGGTTVAGITATSANAVNAHLTMNAPAPGQGTISSLSILPTSVVGGLANATGTVTLASAAGPGGVLVNLASNQASAAVPASIVIPAGQSSGTFPVTTSTVQTTTVAAITATSANSVQANLTVLQAINVTGLSVAPASVTGGTNATGTVTLSAAAPVGGTTVQLTSNNGAAAVPATVIVAQGQTTATFPVQTTPVASNQNATLSATVGASTGYASLTVLQPCLNGLTLNVNTLLGGSGTIGTVTLTGPAPAGGSMVTLASGNGAIQLPSSVFVPEGQTSATFNLTTTPVAVLLSSTIQALFGPCGGVTASVNVQAPILTALGFSPASIPLLGSTVGTVTLNGAAPAGGVAVFLNTPTLLGLLGLTMPSSVVIPGGATSANFPVGTLGLLLNTLNVTVNATSSLGNVSSILTVLP